MTVYLAAKRLDGLWLAVVRPRDVRLPSLATIDFAGIDFWAYAR